MTFAAIAAAIGFAIAVAVVVTAVALSFFGHFHSVLAELLGHSATRA